MDWWLCREMNTLRMGEFLTRLSKAHRAELIVMVGDGDRSHNAKDLVMPENISAALCAGIEPARPCLG